MEYKNDKTAKRRRYKSRYHSPHNYKAKRSRSENRAAVLIGVATFVVLAALILVFTFGDSIYTFLDNTFHPRSLIDELPQSGTIGIEGVTEAPTASAATQTASEAETAAPTEAPQDEDFTRLIAAAGLDSASLTGSQLILVQSNGTDATVYTYEKNADGVWQQKYKPLQGFVGEDGAADVSVPGDSVTPKGTFRIEFAIGTNPNPGAKLNYHQIVDGMRWITDPASINYNRLLDEDATYVDYDEYQELSHYTVSYPYAVVFDYNRDPVDPAQGCAKFLHVSEKPTYGGIGIPESSLRTILKWLDPALSPQISIF